MKRNILKAACAAIAIIAIVSCEDRIVVPEVTSEPVGKAGIVFTATTETAAATKTALSENGGNFDVVWRNGDQITIVDGESHVGKYTTTSTTTTADFTYIPESGAEATASPYKAWYPASLYNGGTPTLPATQNYVEENISGAPMYAESSTTTLNFKNLTGIIRLNITTSESKIVRRITLTADQPLSGPIANVASLNSETPVAATVSGTAGVTLECGAGVAINGTAKPFHIAVPAGTFTNLKITVETTDGQIQTRTSNSGITVARSAITNITLGFNNMVATTGSADIIGGASQPWIQLWPGGPKWAKFNVGSTITSYANVTEYTNPDVIGGYYSFKGRYNSTPDADGTSDTANYLWGVNWVTPTGTQEEDLLNNCIWTYCDGTSVQYEPGCTLAGWKVSGKEAGYTENSIFLPFSGIRDQNNKARETVGTRGCYWSTDTGGYGAYYLNTTSGVHQYVSANKPHGLSVRAICIDNQPYEEGLPDGAIAGLFSVEENVKVYFSKGNLNFVTATSTWKFADDQKDYLGKSQDGGVRDMFTYNEYNEFTDPASWWNLSWQQWKYLLTTRSVTNTLSAGARYTMAKVGGVNGLIIFPDIYIHPEETGFVSGTFDGPSNYIASVDDTGWAKMEAAGCVFLPAAGYKSVVKDWVNVGSAVCYGTSTPIVTEYGDEYYTPYILSDSVSLDDTSYQTTMTAVRLVHTAN